MADYPGATDHTVPRSFLFNSNAHAAIVLHKTGGDATPDAIYRTFLASGKSVHYGVGTDGSIWQYVPEALGAGGNCCVEDGYDPFWTQFNPMYVGSSDGTNLNTVTISIEHCDAALDNSTPLTPVQQEASFKLVAYLVQKYNIPLTHIKGHNSLDPIDKAHCPGNYPWQALFAFLQHEGGTTMGVLLQLAQLVTENQCSQVNIAHVRRQSLPLQGSLYHVSKVTKRNIAFRNFAWYALIIK